MKTFKLTWQGKGTPINTMNIEYNPKEMKVALKSHKRAFPYYKWKPKQCA